MTCSLSLHILDRKTGLPLDIDLPVGVNRSAWPEIVKEAEGFSIRLNWHETESDDSVDGVRSWWTDELPVTVGFLRWLVQYGHSGSAAETVLKTANRWIDTGRELRFIFELV